MTFDYDFRFKIILDKKKEKKTIITINFLMSFYILVFLLACIYLRIFTIIIHIYDTYITEILCLRDKQTIFC